MQEDEKRKRIFTEDTIVPSPSQEPPQLADLISYVLFNANVIYSSQKGKAS